MSRRAPPPWAAGVLAAALLPVLPLSAAFFRGAVPGAGPDVASTLWGMWWAGQVGLLSATGAHTDLANHPYGATGAILSPSGAAAWIAADALLGPARAAAVSAWLTVAGFAAGTAWLAARASGRVGAWGALAAALVPLASRYLFFGVAEGSPVAVAALPLPLGLAALLAARQERWLAAPLAALLMAWTAAENPYLAPVLPAVAALLWLESAWRGRDGRPLLLSLLGGLAGTAAFAARFGRAASPDYPREVAGESVRLFGRAWSVVDLPWARASLADLLWPGPVRWTLSAADAQQATGGCTLGLVALALALVALYHRRSQAWPWLLFALAGAALSLGSLLADIDGFAGPFLLLNGFMDAVARPLTQPTRFLALTLVGLGVAAALAVEALRERFGRRGAALACLALLLEGLLVGGLGLRLPQTDLPPDVPCLHDLDGGVLLWPWDALDGELSTVQQYQIRHGQPSPQTGIASWALAEGRAYDALRGAGWSAERLDRLDLNALLDLGYRWVVLDHGADPEGSARLQARLAVAPRMTCGGLATYRLQDAAPLWPRLNSPRGRQPAQPPRGRRDGG